jgi:proline dehydrogenase
MMRSLLLGASRNALLARTLPRRAFVRRAVRRFLPGESAAEALAAAQAYAARGIGAVLTQLGEQVTNAAEAAAVRDHYLGVYDEIAARALPAEISIKLTHLGLDVDPEACAAHARALAERAEATGTWLFLDMEESRYVDATLALFRRLRERYERVGVCLQAYLHRTPADLEAVTAAGGGVRLVKGAYREPPGVAIQPRREIDAAYVRLARRLLERQPDGLRPVFGTHDGALITAVRRHAEELRIARDRCEFHLLYGIRSDLLDGLRREGVAVRVLITYGTAWFAWYLRRLAERPANLVFLARSLVG